MCTKCIDANKAEQAIIVALKLDLSWISKNLYNSASRWNRSPLTDYVDDENNDGDDVWWVDDDHGKDNYDDDDGDDDEDDKWDLGQLNYIKDGIVRLSANCAINIKHDIIV